MKEPKHLYKLFADLDAHWNKPGLTGYGRTGSLLGDETTRLISGMNNDIVNLIELVFLLLEREVERGEGVEPPPLDPTAYKSLLDPQTRRDRLRHWGP